MPKRHLDDLLAGNRRFAAGTPTAQQATAAGAEMALGQAPYATILSCSDSRVPVETIFDHGPGDIFVVRVAGNFVNDDGLASIEFAVSKLESNLVMVLGHSGCGAAEAAIASLSGTTFPGHIGRLATAVAPAAIAAKAQAGDWYANTIAENVRANVAALTARSAILADAATSGAILICGAVYDIHTGMVRMLS
ncbi:MAG TPA: carbonic anhydrase [Candidatus Baltobacteraceae bacterium]|jgi:carbonic anhydrase